ncbi:unnamed protein product [Paramecium octaurelia]|uniref:Uncharacterized protein n=1 Tax=Paramecium octaurelia TaxID=43137 RepID=A0A8S1VIU1_PAROT|nr:unnamed protein product [Paramecium octaurelia]
MQQQLLRIIGCPMIVLWSGLGQLRLSNHRAHSIDAHFLAQTSIQPLTCGCPIFQPRPPVQPLVLAQSSSLDLQRLRCK